MDSRWTAILATVAALLGGAVPVLAMLWLSSMPAAPDGAAPAPALEQARHEAFAGLDAAADDLGRKARQLALLSDLMVDAGRRRAAASVASSGTDWWPETPGPSDDTGYRISAQAPAIVPTVTAPVATNNVP